MRAEAQRVASACVEPRPDRWHGADEPTGRSPLWGLSEDS